MLQLEVQFQCFMGFLEFVELVRFQLYWQFLLHFLLKLNKMIVTRCINSSNDLISNQNSVYNTILASNGDSQRLVYFSLVFFIIFDESEMSSIISWFLILLLRHISQVPILCFFVIFIDAIEKFLVHLV